MGSDSRAGNKRRTIIYQGLSMSKFAGRKEKAVLSNGKNLSKDAEQMQVKANGTLRETRQVRR